MLGKLTTHVLDIAHGCPGKGINIELWGIQSGSNGEEKKLLKTTTTNHDGRTDEPLLVGEEFTPGVYELVFKLGDYFASREENLSNIPFLDYIPVRFGIFEDKSHYHVPLLVSPWSYSTYRGS